MRARKSQRVPQYESAQYRHLTASLAANVLRHRTARGWTQEQTAERCQMSTYQYQRVEAGVTNVTFTTLARLVAGLQVPGSHLLLDPPAMELTERVRPTTKLPTNRSGVRPVVPTKRGRRA